MQVDRNGAGSWLAWRGLAVGASALDPHGPREQRTAARLSWVTGLDRAVTRRDDSSVAVLGGRLRAEVGGMSTAQRNVRAGITLADAAGEALTAVDDILQRMRELALRAREGDGAAAQAEYEQLVTRLDDLATYTRVGREQLFGGDRVLQVGADEGDTDVLRLGQADAAALGVAGLDLRATTTTTTTTTTDGSTGGATGVTGGQAPPEPGPEPVKDADGDGVVSRDEQTSYGARRTAWRDAVAAYEAWQASQGSTGSTGSTATTTTTSASVALAAIDAAIAALADRRSDLDATRASLVATDARLGQQGAITGAAEDRTDAVTIASRIDDLAVTAATIAVTRNQSMLETAAALPRPTPDGDAATPGLDPLRTERARELYGRTAAELAPWTADREETAAPTITVRIAA